MMELLWPEIQQALSMTINSQRITARSLVVCERIAVTGWVGAFSQRGLLSTYCIGVVVLRLCKELRKVVH